MTRINSISHHPISHLLSHPLNIIIITIQTTPIQIITNIIQDTTNEIIHQPHHPQQHKPP